MAKSNQSSKREFPLGLRVSFTSEKFDFYPNDPARLNMRVEIVEKQPREEGQAGFDAIGLSRYGRDRSLAGLAVEVEGSAKYGLYYRGLKFTGSHYDLGAYELEGMLGSIKPIQRKLAKLADDEGSPSTPGDYLVHLARALGIKDDKIAFDGSDPCVPCHYGPGPIAWRTPGSARDMVNARFRKFGEEQAADGAEVSAELARL